MESSCSCTVPGARVSFHLLRLLLLLPFTAWAGGVFLFLILAPPGAVGAAADLVPQDGTSLCAAKCGTCPVICTSAPPPPSPQSYAIRQLPPPPPPPAAKKSDQSSPPAPPGGQRGLSYPYYYFYTSAAPAHPPPPAKPTECLPLLLLFSVPVVFFFR